VNAKLPDAVVIDANGFWWRTWAEDPMWSMVPTNPDNSPIPQPVKYYRLVEVAPGVQSRATPTATLEDDTE
jgi:hypothetical protein